MMLAGFFHCQTTMCRTADDKATTEWKREIPSAPGEWLWVCQWSCGCVRKAGIAWVTGPDEGPGKEDFGELLPNGLRLHWEGQKPEKNFKWEWVTAWRPITLPPSEWCAPTLAPDAP
ncbi:hypothetical protein AYO47_06530 [Planctomyces sp. SCGC AG-212-M04]|nr:hypothetical protein AYO47_06530 [Planctomyces sp. SCGC AG-212-M04]